MKQLNKGILFITCLSCLCFSLPCLASNTLTNLVYSSQKYLVVTAVVLVIFIGIILFLLHLENRLRKLEKNQTK